ncbi:hypothetical protein [Streptomyces sp. 900105245]
MARNRQNVRQRPVAVLHRTVVSASAVAVLALTLTACDGDGGTNTSSGGGPTATAEPAADGTQTGSTAAGAKPAATPTKAPGSAKSPSAAATPAPAEPGTPSAADGSSGCDHKMPISPDEIAVYRYTPEGGSLGLIVKYGNWGCAPADSDGAPFETVGKEIYLPMDQAAYVTATDPIVAGTENQHIGVQEFLDWLEAHPDSGLVFKYHLGDDGAIDHLDEVFTP